MSTSFEPRLDILPKSQRELWKELDAVPSDFVLYGGTALALQLGHRASEDFDFFASSGFEPDHLQTRLPFFRDLDKHNQSIWVHRKRDNLEAFVTRSGGAVKVAFFGGVKATAWKAVAVVTDYKSCSGRRPADCAPHQAGFKK